MTLLPQFENRLNWLFFLELIKIKVKAAQYSSISPSC